MFSKNFAIVLVLSLLAFGYYADGQLNETKHRYAVLLEVAQMKLEGQVDMEVIMNAKSTTDTTEVNAALDALRTKQ